MSSNPLSLEEFNLCVLLCIARIGLCKHCNADIRVASMRTLNRDLAMHLLLSVKHGIVLHLVHDACIAPECYWLTY